MCRPLLALFFAALLASCDALTVASAHDSSVLVLVEQRAASHPTKALELFATQKTIDKKWNWLEASGEVKTEWATVLKRYVMTDMTTYELVRHFGEALPNSSADDDDQQEALIEVRAKVTKLKANLQKAVLDQNTSDAVAGDMQKNMKTNKLTVHQKRVLADEHNREQYGFFAIEASGQDVLQKAVELLQALDAKSLKPAHESASWDSIASSMSTPAPTYLSMLGSSPKFGQTNTSNSSAPNVTTFEALYQKFEDAARTFHNDLGTFETEQAKVLPSLLAIPPH